MADWKWPLVFQYFSISDRSRAACVSHAWLECARSHTSWPPVPSCTLRVKSSERMTGHEPQFRLAAATATNLWREARAMCIDVPPDSTHFSRMRQESERRRRFDAAVALAVSMPSLEWLDFAWIGKGLPCQLPPLLSAHSLRHLRVSFDVHLSTATLGTLINLESLYLWQACFIESPEALRPLVRLRTFHHESWQRHDYCDDQWPEVLRDLVCRHDLRNIHLDEKLTRSPREFLHRLLGSDAHNRRAIPDNFVLVIGKVKNCWPDVDACLDQLDKQVSPDSSDSEEEEEEEEEDEEAEAAAEEAAEEDAEQ
jgi:hypothetical protein